MAFLLGTWPLRPSTSIFTSAANLRGLVFPSWNIFKTQTLTDYNRAFMGAELQMATLSSPFSTQAPEPLPVESQVLAQPSNDVQSPALLPVHPALYSCAPGGISLSTSRLDPCALFSKDALVSLLGLVCFPRTSHSFCPSC